MTPFRYALPIDDYTWKNAFFWGNCLGHYKKASTGNNYYYRFKHALIAGIELLPIISQVASVFEKIIVVGFNNSKSNTSSPANLSKTDGPRISIDSRPKQAKASRSFFFHIKKLVSTLLFNRPSERQTASIKIQLNRPSERQTASIKIQRVFRGHLARLAVKKEKRHLLNYSIFEQAKPLIDDPKKYRGMPRATNGKTLVCLPDNLPIVLKQSGSPGNKERFDKMKQAREICDESNYSHLVVPTARLWKDFIIESRLPIVHHDTKIQIGFYLDHIEQFTEAVKEFTGFLCQTSLSDITSCAATMKGYYRPLMTGFVGRYDNIAMYLEEGVGKLGLIDLETLNSKSKQSASSACWDAVTLFPHHLDSIIEAARKFDPSIENYRESLERTRDGVLKYFKKIYTNHLDFIKQKDIGFTNPIRFDGISQSRKRELREAVEKMLREENSDAWFTNCLGTNPDATVDRFSAEAFPDILNATLKFITDLLEDSLRKHRESAAISSYPELLLVRTLDFEFGDDRYDDLKKLVVSKLDMLTFRSASTCRSLSSYIIKTILKELERGQEIAYYNPEFGRSDCHCIFC